MADLPPGPRTGPLLTLRYTFDQPRLFAQCRARYGKTFSMRLVGFPPAVVTSDREVIKRLLTGDPLKRRHANDVLKPFLGERSLLLLEPGDHLARRRLELPPFHGEAIRSYTERIRELTQEEIDGWSGAVETLERARKLTLRVILELVLGIRDADLRDRLSAIFDWFDTPLSNLALFLPERLNQRARWNLLTKPAYAQLDRLHALLSSHIERTRSDPELERRTDVLSLLIRSRVDGQALSDADLRDELLTLVSAGHETTATAIAWACDLLAHNPQVAAQLGDETYLKATAKEVLRARTVAYISAGRYSLDPLPIGDHVLGPDVAILVDAQGVHGDPEVYPQPEQFLPERFIDRTPDGYSYLPFGGGAHRCLGAALAMLELELFIETLAARVSLSPTGPPAKPKRRSVTLAPDNAGRVRAAKVQAPALTGVPSPA